MKQYLILGLVALVLFGVSAAMSVWLNRSHAPTEEKSPGEGPTPKKGKEKEKESEPPEKGHGPRPAGKEKDGAGGHDSAPGASVAEVAGLQTREERLARRQAQTDLILRDLQAEREEVDALLRRVTAEAKEAATRPPEPEPKAVPPKKDVEAEAAADQKAIAKLADVYGAMPAESAAPILKQMADSGRLDMASRIIAQMKDRQAAQVLAAMADPALAAQITDKVRTIRRPAPAGGAGAVAPAAAPPPAAGRGNP